MSSAVRRLGAPAARLIRGARRLPRFTLVALLITGTVVVVTRWGGPDRTGDRTLGASIRVGVEHGASIPAYLDQAGGRLAGLDPGQPVVALVGFDRYIGPDELAPALAGGSAAMVLARLPLPGSQTQLVRLTATRLPEDVVAGMEATARRKEVEATGYARLLAESADPERRVVHQTGARIASAEAAAYRAHCACVYAAVIRAERSTLEAIAGRPGVRLVDPAPEVRTLDRAVFLPPLPEQHGVAGPPTP